MLIKVKKCERKAIYKTVNWNIDTTCKFRGVVGRVCHHFSTSACSFVNRLK
jgi:hypothetical protein